MTRVGRWWNEPDQYRWLSEYLAGHGFRRFTRLMIVTIVGLYGVIPLVMLWSPSGSRGPVGTMVAIVITVGCVAMAGLWLVCWPSQVQAVLLAVVSNVGVVAGCLIAGDPRAGMLACTTFAPLAGYVALFHSGRLLVLTLISAAFTTAISAVRVALAGDPAMAIGQMLTVAIAVLAVPFAGQVLLHLLRLDAKISHIDPLTGLHNRRGFYRSALALVPAGADGSTSFSVLVVDLDGFKKINDRHGHVIGDQILVEVANNLRRAGRVNSVVARIGGEEFVIAETSDATAARQTAENMLVAVAATPWGITASVGAATMTPISVEPEAAQQLIEQLVEAADTAMYEAKRAGGNQVRLQRCTSTPPALNDREGHRG